MAVGPIKDDAAGAVNYVELASIREESPDDTWKEEAWRNKGKRGSIKPG